MLMSGDLPQGSLCTTNSVSNLIDELQFTLGEGPCIDAYHHDRVVLEPDLAHPDTPRWFAFTPRALDAGVRAIFGFPLKQGAARLGALHLYQSQPGHLSDDQHADALVMAEVIAQQVINTQAGALPGSVAEDLEAGADFHSIVHNAAGIVSVQLGVSVTEALVRLRAYAFSENRLVRDVAQDVVTRRLKFQ
jgi:GAF domain-containing protein